MSHFINLGIRTEFHKARGRPVTNISILPGSEGSPESETRGSWPRKWDLKGVALLFQQKGTPAQRPRLLTWIPWISLAFRNLLCVPYRMKLEAFSFDSCW